MKRTPKRSVAEAAWIPLENTTPYWTEEATLAVKWIRQRAEVDGKAPLLVTSNMADLSAPTLRDAALERISVLDPPDPLPTSDPTGPAQ